MTGLLFFITLFSGLNLESSQDLDSGGKFFDRLRLARIQTDGSIIVVNRHKIFHFAADGRLLNQFGEKGNGPGEFEMAFSCFWTGKNYMVMDNRRRDFSYFNDKGEFLHRHAGRVRDLVFYEGKTLMVDTQRIKSNLPPISLVTTDDQAKLVDSGRHFHRVHDKTARFSYNFANIYVTGHKGLIYVMDQLDKGVTGYNAKFEKVTEFEAELAGFVEPTEGSEPMSRKERFRHARSFSSIDRLQSIDLGLVISYMVPDPNDPDNVLAMVVLVNDGGKATSKATVQPGHLLGTYNNRVYFISENDDISYTVSSYSVTQSMKGD